jgi:hypothetical protein
MIMKTTIALFTFFISFLVFKTQAQEAVYFCGGQLNGWYDVWKYNMISPNGGNFEKLVADYTYNYWWVEPSPDDTKLLLMRTPAVPGIPDQFNYDSCQMVVYDLVTNAKTVIVDYEQYGWKAFGNPHWHPSGNRIILLAQPTNEFFLFTINTDGTNPQQISNQFSIDPNWSKSGDKITFIGINSVPTFPASFDDFEVFTADYDYPTNALSNIQQLTNDTLRDQDPCFSIDDTQIVFSSGSENLSYANLVQIEVNGTNRTDLVNDGTTNGGPINWGSNNKIYYHHVNLFVTPFRAKTFDVTNAMDSILWGASFNGKSISPYYKNAGTLSTSNLDNLQTEILIYPNPMKDELIIKFPDLKNLVEITISNLEGKTVLESTISELSTSLDVSDFSSGVYILQLKTDNQIINRKINKSW